MNVTELLRLKVLLKWAVHFVEQETIVIHGSYRDQYGNIADEDVALELKDAARWLTEAREALAATDRSLLL